MAHLEVLWNRPVNRQYPDRVLALYNLTQNVVRNGNVDTEDQLSILVAYKKCLVARFKTCESQRKEFKQSLKDQLLPELTVKYVDKLENENHEDVTSDELVYDICSYILHSRSQVLNVKYANRC
jgi:hypothetical protein